MKWRRFVLAGSLTLLLPAIGFAQQSAEELAARLNSSNYDERQSAGRALDKLGAAALPVLEKALSSANLETKRRAGALLERIEARLVIEELLQPTPLHLRLRHIPLHEA